jgi:signal transduction histidine kinase
MEVGDDGRGFDASSLEQRRSEGHVGLAALRGLVRDAGGTFAIESEPGDGTVLRVEVPLG